MKRQRGMVLMLTLTLSLLLGLLVASGLREALLLSWTSGELLRAAQALEDAQVSLLEGREQLSLAPPQACLACQPPATPHDIRGDEPFWQQGSRGFFLLQNLGESTLAAHVPEGEPVTLFRITAVSQQVRARHVLEAVYAVSEQSPESLQRILWRQRLREH
ncbi:hypothetical protein ACQKPE_24410 [Pseudomonas sp. NPDC089554]|uniref:hypothetical protein n=1 Tax=Pseudomonas sp. NPDC089554 TaxID=3390653 RepID=UPI003D0042ED